MTSMDLMKLLSSNSSKNIRTQQNKRKYMAVDLAYKIVIECPHCSCSGTIDIDNSPDSNSCRWDVSSEAKLENMLSTYLFTTFKIAISIISSYGYDEETATNAVLWSEICNGCKDTTSNIVDNALNLLKNGKIMDSSRHHVFEDLQQLTKHIIHKMLFVLRESPPRLSHGDAMWCLLVFDMKMSDACAMAAHYYYSCGFDTKETRSSSSVSQLKHDTVSSTPVSACSPSLSTENIEITSSVPSTDAKVTTDGIFLNFVDYVEKKLEKMDSEHLVRHEVFQMVLGCLLGCRFELCKELRLCEAWASKRMHQALSQLKSFVKELNSLRAEKEKASRRQKKSEEKALKSIKKFENTLLKVNDEIKMLDVDKEILMDENARMTQAKIDAEHKLRESAAIYDKTLNIQKTKEPSEQDKTVFHKDLLAEKNKLTEMRKTVEKAKSHLKKLEGNIRKDEMLKDQILLLTVSEREQREQMVISAKMKEDAIASQGEKKLQRYREKIQKLETRATQLRSKTTDGNISVFTNSTDSIPVVLNSLESKHEDVNCKRKCIMCLTEEFSVVFLPCAHQVICNNCDELHQNQGRKDCPYCRSLIERRVRVRHLDSRLL